MLKLMYYFSNRELPFFGCKLIVNQLKYGGEEVWNHVQMRCSVSISCFKDLVDQENYLFFSNLFFLLFSIVFFHKKHSGHFQCFCGIVSVLQFLCFLWVTWFWKQTSKQLKTNTIKRKKMVLMCHAVKRLSHDCSVKFKQQFWFGIALITLVMWWLYTNKRSIR